MAARAAAVVACPCFPGVSRRRSLTPAQRRELENTAIERGSELFLDPQPIVAASNRTRLAAASYVEEAIKDHNFRTLADLLRFAATDLPAQVFAKLRDESVKARRESGVEELMAACEDAYLGIDDQNRPAERSQWAKPTSMVGPLTKHIPRNGNKSTAFVRLTARYVDMGAAKVSEITLPIDGKAFSFGPTPVPELAAALEDQTPVQGPNGPVTQQMPDGSAKPLTVGDLAKKRMEKATEAAEKAETRIYDWMVESRYPMQMRKVMHDAARLGVGVLKAPFPELRKAQSFSVKDGVAVLESIQKVTPAYKWVSPWNLFPHKGCGEDIHTGDFLFERAFRTIAKRTRGPIGC